MKRVRALLAGCLFLYLATTQSVRAYTITETSAGKHIRWATDVVALRAAPSFRNMLSEGDAERALTLAIEAWRGYPGVPDLVFAGGVAGPAGRVDQSAGNGVHLLKVWPYPSHQLAVTVVTYEVQSGRMLNADILVNGEVPYRLLAEGTAGDDHDYDLAAVLTHESGHVLGLGESHDDPEATMWPYANPGDTRQRTLAEDDEEGAIAVYQGPPPQAAAGCGTASVGGSLTRSDSAAWYWSLPLLLALVRNSRRTWWTVLTICGCGLAIAASGVTDSRRPTQPGSASVHAVQRQLGRLGEDFKQGSGGENRVAARDASAQSTIRHDSLRGPGVGDEFAKRAAAERPARADNGTRVAVETGAATLAALLKDRPQHHVGRAQRGEVDKGEGLWSTRYELVTSDGERVEFWLPGGCDGAIAQRVGSEDLPENGSELMIAQDSHGHPIWTYHHRGRVYGGALGQHDAAYSD